MNYKTYFEIKENRFVGFQHTLLTVDTHKNTSTRDNVWKLFFQMAKSKIKT